MGIASVVDRIQRLELEAKDEPFTGAIPLKVHWGVYARQSTIIQVKNNLQSLEMQTQDLTLWLRAKGVTGQIDLFDEDLGVSGSKRIDQRTGLQMLVDKIKAGIIKAVLVANVSRLFRDDTGVQYNLFAQICAENNCILVTADGLILNFRNPLHLRMFRYLAEMAADYLTSQIKMQQDLRMRKALQGKWAGYGALPKGYMVDYNTKSLSYEKFVPYIPHADVILEMFLRHFEIKNFSALCQEYNAKPFVFPLVTLDVDRRVVSKWRFKPVVDGDNVIGYHITRSGLISILTNPIYIGWWIIAGNIVSKENHTAIIPSEYQELFWYSFNALSDYTIEGAENEKRELGKRTFYQKDTSYQKDAAPQQGILKDRVVGIEQVEHKMEGSVYAHYDNRNGWRYVLYHSANVWRKSEGVLASIVDDEFSRLFRNLLAESQDVEEYKDWLEARRQEKESKKASLLDQLAGYERRQKALVDEMLDIRMTINEYPSGAEREKAKAEAEPFLLAIRQTSADIEKQKADVASQLAPLSEVDEGVTEAEAKVRFQDSAARLIDAWEEIPFSHKKEFVNIFVERAVLDIPSTHWIMLEIYWSFPLWEPCRLLLCRSKGSTPFWTEPERELLKTHFTATDRDELCKMLPTKSWNAIISEAREHGLTRPELVNRRSKISLGKRWSYHDYLFMSENGISFNGEPMAQPTIYIPLSI